MATDLNLLVENLRKTYNVDGKTVCVVGAGGGQIVNLYHGAEKILALDTDKDALMRLDEALTAEGLKSRAELFNLDFLSFGRHSDVVVFEFSLHEMEHPLLALMHARDLADEVVVVDHSPDSSWAWYACEEEKVRESMHAIESVGFRKQTVFSGTQTFKNRSDVLQRVGSQSPIAIERTGALSEEEPVNIPMHYHLTLI